MMNRQILFLCLLFFAVSCDIKDNDVLPTNTFTKIFDDSRFEQEYYPLDIIQTPDGGFLILSEKKSDQSIFTSVHVLKVDELGNVITSVEMDAPFVLPVNGWQKIDNSFFFVCMDGSTLTAQLVPVTADGTLGVAIPLYGITYPLVATKDGNDLVMLSFNNIDGESVISKITTSGQITQQASYTIGAGVDVEKPIIDHLTRNGKQLPFIIGKTPEGLYYFNGFFKYTFSLVFTNFGEDPVGVCQGQLSQGGISAVSSLGNDVFGIARFNFGANYLNPSTSISTNSISSSADLGGNIFPEIETNSRVKLLNFDEAEGKWIYSTFTQSNQIVLYGFNQSTGNILGTEYLGDGNPYALASAVATSDGGIAILAQTALEGRFQRIALFKRDADFLNSLLK